MNAIRAKHGNLVRSEFFWWLADKEVFTLNASAAGIFNLGNNDGAKTVVRSASLCGGATKLFLQLNGNEANLCRTFVNRTRQQNRSTKNCSKIFVLIEHKGPD